MYELKIIHIIRIHFLWNYKTKITDLFFEAFGVFTDN